MIADLVDRNLTYECCGRVTTMVNIVHIRICRRSYRDGTCAHGTLEETCKTKRLVVFGCGRCCSEANKAKHGYSHWYLSALTF